MNIFLYSDIQRIIESFCDDYRIINEATIKHYMFLKMRIGLFNKWRNKFYMNREVEEFERYRKKLLIRCIIIGVLEGLIEAHRQRRFSADDEQERAGASRLHNAPVG